MPVIAYILLSGALGVSGQIILKRSVLEMGPLAFGWQSLLSDTVSLLLNPGVVLGVAVTLSGTFFWLVALSRVDLSYAYPFASLNYILVLISSWLLLGEQPSVQRLLGVLIICLGVWAVSRTPAKTRRAASPPVGQPNPREKRREER